MAPALRARLVGDTRFGFAARFQRTLLDLFQLSLWPLSIPPMTRRAMKLPLQVLLLLLVCSTACSALTVALEAVTDVDSAVVAPNLKDSVASAYVPYCCPSTMSLGLRIIMLTI